MKTGFQREIWFWFETGDQIETIQPKQLISRMFMGEFNMETGYLCMFFLGGRIDKLEDHVSLW